LSAIVSSLPEGVTINVHEHLPDHEEVRYIPDLELKELKDVLTSMGGPTEKKKKR
jgi:large subunit ribosomal protein L48